MKIHRVGQTLFGLEEPRHFIAVCVDEKHANMIVDAVNNQDTLQMWVQRTEDWMNEARLNVLTIRKLENEIDDLKHKVLRWKNFCEIVQEDRQNYDIAMQTHLHELLMDRIVLKLKLEQLEKPEGKE